MKELTISQQDELNLARAFLSAINRYFEDPEHVKEFEEWKKQKCKEGEYQKV